MRKIRTVTWETNKKVLTFRELQILSIDYKHLNASYYQGMHTLSVIVIGVVCTYSSILWAQDLAAGADQLGLNLLYLWCMFVTMLGTVFIYGTLADVYKMSKRVKQEMNGKVEFRRNKWFKRVLVTCPSIRIYIGGSNFWDELTPLTLEDFVIDKVVSLLLLQE